MSNSVISGHIFDRFVLFSLGKMNPDQLAAAEPWQRDRCTCLPIFSLLMLYNDKLFGLI